MINEKLITIFSEMAILHDMKDEFFQARAYDKAVEVLHGITDDLRTIYKEGGTKALDEIEGIGKGLARKIEEYIKTQHIKEYDKLKEEIPVDILELTRLEGVGPKTVKKLYNELGVKSVSGLERAVKK